MSSRDTSELGTSVEVTGSELELLCDALEPSTLAPDWRKRLLGSVTHSSRFERFVSGVAEMLQIEACLARQYLDWLAEPQRWVPGFLPQMQVFHLEPGVSLGPAIAGFVRLASGVLFPEHEHLGQESVLVMQGSCDESGRIIRPGERLEMPAGSSHSFVVRPGPDLLYLAIVQTGLRIGGREILAQSASSLDL